MRIHFKYLLQKVKLLSENFDVTLISFLGGLMNTVLNFRAGFFSDAFSKSLFISLCFVSNILIFLTFF